MIKLSPLYNIQKYILLLILLLPLSAHSQVRFSNEKLKDPGKYGEEISSSIKTTEVFEYKKEKGTCVFLKAGLRSSSFVNIDDWLNIKDSVEAYKVDIVYSKYPLRNGVYKEIYPLLFARLRGLFTADPYLNDTSVMFQKILQTNCSNDDQVKNLFHGIVIWYRLNDEQDDSEQALTKPENISDTIPEKYTMFLNRTSVKDMEQVIDNITNSPIFPDSVKNVISGRPVEEKTELIKEYLEEAIIKDSAVSFLRSTDEKRNDYKNEVSYFLNVYHTTDSVVFEVLNRHPEWEKMIVINDWTGSMYGYGAQVLQWHLLNYKRSGITNLTLFNDGDNKRDGMKVIGSTSGIYSEKADNVANLVNLFNLVMLKGGGGDSPENDIEAILKAIEENPDCSNVLLIADYFSCVRDISLADRIKVPVKIILCGYSDGKPMNPDYVYLAKVTGGGIYTIEEDIENLEAEIGPLGEVISCTDKRISKHLMVCGEYYDILSAETDTLSATLKDLKKGKKTIRKLDLSNSNLKRIPAKVLRNEAITSLNLTNNRIKKIPSRIRKLVNLKTLILAQNQIEEIPDDLAKILYLEKLDLSKNKLTTVPATVLGMKYLSYLDLSGNQINLIAKSNNLKKLEYLDLSGNQLKTFPKSFGQMKKLKTLYLADNLIEVVPTALTGLTKLKELDLSNNDITVLPSQIRRWKKLKNLNLQGNKFSPEEKSRIEKLLPKTKILF